MTKPLKDHLATLEAQLDISQAPFDDEHQGRTEAVAEAARAFAQLEAIYRRYWWQVLRPERPKAAD